MPRRNVNARLPTTRDLRLVALECGHEVLTAAGAHTVRCAACRRLVPVAPPRFKRR